MKNHIALRIFLALNLIVTGCAMLFGPSMMPPEWTAAIWSGALLAIIDAVINDCMSDRFSFPLIAERRHWLYMLLAALSVAAAFYLVQHKIPTIWLISRLVLDATVACWCAVMDIKNRYVTPRAKESATNAYI